MSGRKISQVEGNTSLTLGDKKEGLEHKMLAVDQETKNGTGI
jgi:hypothetical protein